MEFLMLAQAYEEMNTTTKRLEMTAILAELFKVTDSNIIDKVVYLTLGKIGPDFEDLEVGVGESVTQEAISFATGVPVKKIKAAWIKHGDLGLTVEDLASQSRQTSLFQQNLSVEKVFTNLRKVAEASGSRSKDAKIKMLGELLLNSSPVEAKYIVKAVNSNLRLGVADMTIVDALVQAFSSENMEKKEAKAKVERAYNLCSDLGHVARVVAEQGIGALDNIKLKVGVPLRAMLAERLGTMEEILEKMEGRAVLEYKYDGLRVQAHIDKGGATLFSRRLEDITAQFPDVVESLQNAFSGKEAILEGECVAVDSEGEMQPFQVVSHRRGRKYDLDKKMLQYPVSVFLFDCLFLDGEELVEKGLLDRRKRLESCIKEVEGVKLSIFLEVDEPEAGQKFFLEAIEKGCEGIMAKGFESKYQAGSRGWSWIKYKRDYRAEMVDTVDLVVVGAFAGHGRRTGVYGTLLMAAFNKELGRYETVCKLGSGFDDATLGTLKERFKPFESRSKPKDVVSNMKADYWFQPGIVMEVVGAEITLSPIHTCAFGEKRDGAGLAIRFPRFAGRWRDDKGPEDATNIKEMLQLYDQQLKKL